MINFLAILGVIFIICILLSGAFFLYCLYEFGKEDDQALKKRANRIGD